MHVLLVGNLTVGFFALGPFEDYGAAVAHAEEHVGHGYWFVFEVLPISESKPMNPAQHVEIEVVIDRSGSMQSIATDAIGGYNTWLAAQQAIPGPASLTLTLFDHEFLTLPTVNLGDAQPLTSATYIPRGNTALNDAMGRALGRLEAKNPEKAILVVLTDGHENCSTEFSTDKIKERVLAAQARGWQVVYLSADINAFAHARNYGVNLKTTSQFDHTGVGTRAAYMSASTLNASYRGAPPAQQAADPYAAFADSLSATPMSIAGLSDPAPAAPVDLSATNSFDASPSCDTSSSFDASSSCDTSSGSTDASW